MIPPLIHELVEFDNVEQRGPIRIAPHVHHFFQMDLIFAGRMELRTRNDRFILEKGYGTLIPPLATHGFGIAEMVHHVTFKFRVHQHYSSQLGHDPQVFQFGRAQRAIAESTRRWSNSTNVLNVHEAIGAATLCLVHAMRACPRPVDGDSSSYPSSDVWAVVNDVIAHPDADWSVKNMAEQCHLSVGHFSKKFVRSFGQVPRTFLLDARIRGAVDQLNTTNASIKSVAQATGYANVHSFSRAFKRATGLTPATYFKPKGHL
jgi:AraC-like DNA-binding protein